MKTTEKLLDILKEEPLTTEELFEMLAEDILGLQTDILMCKLFFDCENPPAPEEVVADYINLLQGHLEQHSRDIAIVSSALCNRLVSVPNDSDDGLTVHQHNSSKVYPEEIVA